MKAVNRKREERFRGWTDAAFELISNRGFAAVTAEDIAHHLGISRATFFRHFHSKEHVIIAAITGSPDQFAKALEGRQVRLNSPLWSVMRSIFEPTLDHIRLHPDQIKARVQLIQHMPGLAASLRQVRAQQVDALAKSLESRGVDPVAAGVLASASVAAFDRSLVWWAEQANADLPSLIDESFSRLALGY